MTTPSQAAFEAWFQTLNTAWPASHVFKKQKCGDYDSIVTITAWTAWQAAEAHGRKQALEDYKLLLTALVDASDYYAVDNIDQYHIEADAMKGLLT